MKRMTLAQLRREAWRVLTKELSTIWVVETPNDCTAHSLYDDSENGSIEIWADHVQTRLDYAVIHEILHRLLDKYLRTFAHYHLYELWITSLEKPFFKPMSQKETTKWQKVIRSKLVVKRR